MKSEELTQRENEILESIVQLFVLTGDPVGSRTISKKSGFKISAATIRNVMSDLEEKGFLDHPHTSAGRVPTSKGYRHYVDNLLHLTKLSKNERNLIIENIYSKNIEIDQILEKTSRILATLSNQLGIILTPRFHDAILVKIELISIASDKLLVILNLTNSPAQTIILEINHDLSANKLIEITSLLNERISGLPLREIRESFQQRMSDYEKEETGLIRLFLNSADRIFNLKQYTDIKYTGTRNIITNPEFADVEKFSAFVELLENKNIIIHMLEQSRDLEDLKITIGEENQEKFVQECSIITAPYKWGDVNGILGVIGPMRMAYRKVIPLVDYTAKIVSRMFEKE